MSELSIWFERKFVFDFPVEMYPNLRVRVRGTPPRLEELCRGLSPEVLTRKPEGKWSIQENVGHLLDLEELWATRLGDYLAGRERLAPANLTNRRTHEANHNARSLNGILMAFRVARLDFAERLDLLHAADFARLARHPRLDQQFRLVDHVYFIAEHDDHHLARIWELRREAAHATP